MTTPTPHLTLTYLYTNAAWVFRYGETITALAGYPYFFSTRRRAQYAANTLGLHVSRTGRCYTRPSVAKPTH